MHWSNMSMTCAAYYWIRARPICLQSRLARLASAATTRRELWTSAHALRGAIDVPPGQLSLPP